nr:immunoglobulin heavy chain junction region [Macaca mulatta]MOW98936.1 immunoglobulin heavy chain junction region [Macaca mulatta]MOX00401.1 immunoglobulin heavy chain junction region [Macaca mulatta]MOX00453.1 immunoglobulin heavy chain junction region [Macaca mulatta]MOX00573.1 immunoglobulin heavy chain junction region [Macaca mulatta]
CARFDCSGAVCLIRGGAEVDYGLDSW